MMINNLEKEVQVSTYNQKILANRFAPPQFGSTIAGTNLDDLPILKVGSCRSIQETGQFNEPDDPEEASLKSSRNLALVDSDQSEK